MPNQEIEVVFLGDSITEMWAMDDVTLMPDMLHLSDKGYRIWAEAIQPVVKKLMR